MSDALLLCWCVWSLPFSAYAYSGRSLLVWTHQNNLISYFGSVRLCRQTYWYLVCLAYSTTGLLPTVSSQPRLVFDLVVCLAEQQRLSLFQLARPAR